MAKRVAAPVAAEGIPTADVMTLARPEVPPEVAESQIIHLRPKTGQDRLKGYVPDAAHPGEKVAVYDDEAWEVISDEEYQRLHDRGDLIVPSGESYPTPTIDHERITSAVDALNKATSDLNEFTTEVRVGKTRLKDLELDLENTVFDSQDELQKARDAERELIDRIDYLERYGIDAAKKAHREADLNLSGVRAEIFDPVWAGLEERAKGLEAESIKWLVQAILNRRDAYVSARTAEALASDMGIVGRTLGNGTRTALSLVEKAWGQPTMLNINQMIATLNARLGLTLALIEEEEDE